MNEWLQPLEHLCECKTVYKVVNSYVIDNGIGVQLANTWHHLATYNINTTTINITITSTTNKNTYTTSKNKIRNMSMLQCFEFYKQYLEFAVYFPIFLFCHVGVHVLLFFSFKNMILYWHRQWHRLSFPQQQLILGKLTLILFGLLCAMWVRTNPEVFQNVHRYYFPLKPRTLEHNLPHGCGRVQSDLELRKSRDGCGREVRVTPSLLRPAQIRDTGNSRRCVD